MAGVREVVGDGCCQEGMKGLSLEAVLEEARTSLLLTDAQLGTLKAILERHGIRTGAHVCPMTQKGEAVAPQGAVPGGCCAAKKESKAGEKASP